MFSRASMAGLAVGVALCLGTVLLWGRSYFFIDSLSFVYPGSNLAVAIDSQWGAVTLNFQTYANMPRLNTHLPGWHSRAVNRGWQFFTIRSMLSFRWADRTFQIPLARNSGIVTIHNRSIAAPTWTLFVLSLLLPVWIFWKGRRDVRWQFRNDVTWKTHRLRMRVARFAVFSMAGIIMGAIVGWLDIEFQFGRTPWIWTVVLFALLPVVVLSAVFTRRRVPWHRALLWMSLELAGCLCFFQATIERISRHFIAFWYYDTDLPQMVLFVGVSCFICGAVLLMFLQVKPEKAKPGPYCPECGYCLIGLPKQICSECGRPFTLEELGIRADELVPGRTIQELF